jgi:hypothetical protein
MEPFSVIATNRPALCAKRLKSKAVGSKLQALNPHVFCHESDRAAVALALCVEGLSVPIFTHTLICINGSAPFGGLRYFAMQIAQENMTTLQFGILLDDDLKVVRLISSTTMKGNGKPSWLKADTVVFISQIKSLVKAARSGFYPYFGVGFNAGDKSGCTKESMIRPAVTWSGFFGFFKDSPNPFDCNFTVGADGAAMGWILNTVGERAVLRHWGLTMEFKIESKAYVKGGSRDRVGNLEEVVRRYPQLVHISTNNKTKTPQLKWKTALGGA